MKKMEIKIGQYVRTKHRNEVVIRKIVNIFEDSKEHDHRLIFDKPTKYQYYVEDYNFIAKEKPIGLIETGDVIAGPDGRKFEVYAVGNDCVYINELKEFINVDEIKTIMTKEQFENLKYVIEE